MGNDEFECVKPHIDMAINASMKIPSGSNQDLTLTSI